MSLVKLGLNNFYSVNLHEDRYIQCQYIQDLTVSFELICNRVPTSSGNHGKPGKLKKKVPCMEKTWNLKKPE